MFASAPIFDVGLRRAIEYQSDQIVTAFAFAAETDRLNQMADAQLDATGLKCPIPVLKARKVVRGLQGGTTLEILATDPGSVPDFEAFCTTGGHELLDHSKDGDVFRFLIRIAGGS